MDFKIARGSQMMSAYEILDLTTESDCSFPIQAKPAQWLNSMKT
jgi:hypothetical protein